MSRVIVLDTGPIGLITNPKLSEQSVACNRWLQAHLRASNSHFGETLFTPWEGQYC